MNTTIASSITKAASTQTYYTIRFLVDRERADDAYRAYGYFRWVDDILDADSGSETERMAFLKRQKSLLEQCYQGQVLDHLSLHENMLAELVQHDTENNSGLQLYLRNMMKVMEFDARRRGRLIQEAELNEYTRWLACGVMEAIHYFIGHDDYSSHDETRYLAVSAAHITHMLRDTFDDMQLGYYNIPEEILDTNRIRPQDVESHAYRAWVKSRVRLAREHFKAGRNYFAQVENPRCRLACFAYIARFEWLLDTFEREDYCLRPQYNERRSAATGMRMIGQSLSAMMHARRNGGSSQSILPRSPENL